MAIATESKHFISSPLVQAIVNHIYNGRVVYSITSNNSVLADNYKPRAIDFYNAHRAPFLDHYRLRVPKYAAILEFLNFVALLFLFLLALSSKYKVRTVIRYTHETVLDKDSEVMTSFEIAFIVYTVSFALDEYTASKEHGWESELSSFSYP